MDSVVADRAILIPDVRLVMQGRRRRGIGIADLRMAFHAELADRAAVKHLRIARPVRCVTRRAALRLKRSVFENERALLFAVALDAGYIGSDGEFGLFRFESAVSVMTARAGHGAFQYFVMKRFAKLSFSFCMAAHTELRFALL